MPASPTMQRVVWLPTANAKVSKSFKEIGVVVFTIVDIMFPLFLVMLWKSDDALSFFLLASTTHPTYCNQAVHFYHAQAILFQLVCN